MAIAVVESLEPVDVEHHQRERAAAALRTGQLAPGTVEKRHPVRKAGQRVDRRPFEDHPPLVRDGHEEKGREEEERGADEGWQDEAREENVPRGAGVEEGGEKERRRRREEERAFLPAQPRQIEERRSPEEDQRRRFEPSRHPSRRRDGGHEENTRCGKGEKGEPNPGMGQLEKTKKEKVGQGREKDRERGAQPPRVVLPDRKARGEKGREARREEGVEKEVPPAPVAREEEKRDETERGDRHRGRSRDQESREELAGASKRRRQALRAGAGPRGGGQENDREEQRADDRRDGRDRRDRRVRRSRPAGTRQRRFFSSSLAARLVAVIVAQ